MLEQIFDMEINSINPMTARKNVFGKARVKGKKAKEFVQEEIKDKLEDLKERNSLFDKEFDMEQETVSKMPIKVFLINLTF